MKVEQVSEEEAQFAGQYAIYFNGDLVDEGLQEWEIPQWKVIGRKLEKHDSDCVTIRKNIGHGSDSVWIRVDGTDELNSKGVQQLASAHEESDEHSNVSLSVYENEEIHVAPNDQDPFEERVPHEIVDAIGSVFDRSHNVKPSQEVGQEFAEHLRTLARRYETEPQRARDPRLYH